MGITPNIPGSQVKQGIGTATAEFFKVKNPIVIDDSNREMALAKFLETIPMPKANKIAILEFATGKGDEKKATDAVLNLIATDQEKSDMLTLLSGGKQISMYPHDYYLSILDVPEEERTQDQFDDLFNYKEELKAHLGENPLGNLGAFEAEKAINVLSSAGDGVALTQSLEASQKRPMAGRGSNKTPMSRLIDVRSKESQGWLGVPDLLEGITEKDGVKVQRGISNMWKVVEDTGLMLAEFAIYSAAGRGISGSVPAFEKAFGGTSKVARTIGKLFPEGHQLRKTLAGVELTRQIGEKIKNPDAEMSPFKVGVSYVTGSLIDKMGSIKSITNTLSSRFEINEGTLKRLFKSKDFAKTASIFAAQTVGQSAAFEVEGLLKAARDLTEDNDKTYFENLEEVAGKVTSEQVFKSIFVMAALHGSALKDGLKLDRIKAEQKIQLDTEVKGLQEKLAGGGKGIPLSKLASGETVPIPDPVTAPDIISAPKSEPVKAVADINNKAKNTDREPIQYSVPPIDENISMSAGVMPGMDRVVNVLRGMTDRNKRSFTDDQIKAMNTPEKLWYATQGRQGAPPFVDDATADEIRLKGYDPYESSQIYRRDRTISRPVRFHPIFYSLFERAIEKGLPDKFTPDDLASIMLDKSIINTQELFAFGYNKLARSFFSESKNEDGKYNKTDFVANLEKHRSNQNLFEVIGRDDGSLISSDFPYNPQASRYIEELSATGYSVTYSNGKWHAYEGDWNGESSSNIQTEISEKVNRLLGTTPPINPVATTVSGYGLTDKLSSAGDIFYRSYERSILSNLEVFRSDLKSSEVRRPNTRVNDQIASSMVTHRFGQGMRRIKSLEDVAVHTAPFQKDIPPTDISSLTPRGLKQIMVNTITESGVEISAGDMAEVLDKTSTHQGIRDNLEYLKQNYNPFKDGFMELLIKRELQAAVAEGFEFFTWPDVNKVAKVMGVKPGELPIEIYDKVQKLDDIATKYVRKYGLEPREIDAIHQDGFIKLRGVDLVSNQKMIAEFGMYGQPISDRTITDFGVGLGNIFAKMWDSLRKDPDYDYKKDLRTAGLVVGGDKEITPEQIAKVPDMTRDAKFVEESISYALTPDGKVKMGADIVKLAKQSAASMYRSPVSKIIPREMFQNAIDAVRGDPNGEITVNWTSVPIGSTPAGDNYLQTWTFRDNGKGMTAEELQTVFVDLGSSGKTGSSETSGKFGIGNAVVFLSSDKVNVKSGENNMTFTGEELLKGEVKMEKLDTPIKGTEIQVSFKYRYNYVPEEIKELFRLSPNKITFNGEVVRRDMLSPPVHTVNIADADIQVGTLIGKKTKGSRGKRPVMILNNGMLIEELSKLTPPGSDDLYVNIKSRAEAGSPNYPFTTSREDLTYEFRRIVDKALESIESESAKNIAKHYSDSVTRSPVIRGTSVRVLGLLDGDTAKLESIFESYPAARDLVKLVEGLDRLAKNIQIDYEETIHHTPSDITARDQHHIIGITNSEEYHGVNIRYLAPDNTFKKAIFLNFPSLISGGTKSTLSIDKVTMNILLTIPHEVTHNLVRDHDQEFNSTLENTVMFWGDNFRQQYDVVHKFLSENIEQLRSAETMFRSVARGDLRNSALGELEDMDFDNINFGFGIGQLFSNVFTTRAQRNARRNLNNPGTVPSSLISFRDYGPIERTLKAGNRLVYDLLTVPQFVALNKPESRPVWDAVSESVRDGNTLQVTMWSEFDNGKSWKVHSTEAKNVSRVIGEIQQVRGNIPAQVSDIDLANRWGLSPNEITLYRGIEALTQKGGEIMKNADYERLLHRIGEMNDTDYSTLANNHRQIVVDMIAAGFNINANTKPAGPEMMELSKRINEDRYQNILVPNYFPMTRLNGEYAVRAIAPNGDLLGWNTYKSTADAKKALPAFQRQFPNSNVQVYERKKFIREYSNKLNLNELDSLISETGASFSDPNIERLRSNLVSRMTERHKVQRNLTPGVEWNPEFVIEALDNFVNIVSRDATRPKGIRKAKEALRNIKDPSLYSYMDNYIENWKKSNNLEFASLRAGISHYYLGMKMSFPIVNALQRLTTTYPTAQAYITRLRSPLNAEKVFAESQKEEILYDNYRYQYHFRGNQHAILPNMNSDLVTDLEKASGEGIIGAPFADFLLGRERNTARVGIRAWEKFSRLMSVFNTLTEKSNRIQAFITGWKIADSIGMGHAPELRYKFASDFVEETQGAYGVHNLPQFIAGGGKVKPLMRLAYTFRHYGISYHNLLARNLKLGIDSGDYRAFGKMMAASIVAAGVTGLPGYQLFKTMWKSIFGDDPEIQIREFFTDNGVDQTLQNVVLRGAPNAAGVDLSYQAGAGDLIPSRMDATAILGAPYGIVTSAGFALDQLKRGDVERAAIEIAPTFIKNAALAYKAVEEGGYVTKEGNVIYKPTNLEAGLLALSFVPTELALERFKISLERMYRAQKTDNVSIFNDRIVNAIISGDRGDLEEITSDIIEYNRGMAEKKMIGWDYKTNIRNILAGIASRRNLNARLKRQPKDIQAKSRQLERMLIPQEDQPVEQP